MSYTNRSVFNDSFWVFIVHQSPNKINLLVLHVLFNIMLNKFCSLNSRTYWCAIKTQNKLHFFSSIYVDILIIFDWGSVALWKCQLICNVLSLSYLWGVRLCSVVTNVSRPLEMSFANAASGENSITLIK